MNNIAPLVSIIIPTFNCESTLKTCLKSIIDQTYKRWEIILIDNLSTDDTPNIISDFISNFPGITYISENDKGIYYAMNKGINLAQGNWLYFLGSDDFLFSELILEKIFNNCNNDFDVIYGNVFSPRFNGVYNGEYSVEKLFENNLCHQSIFFKRKVFNTTGLFNLQYKYYADWDHNFKWLGSDKIKKKYINEIIAFYADGGLSSRKVDQSFLNVKRWMFIKFKKKQTSFSQKLLLAGKEIKYAVKENRIQDAKNIFLEIPYLFF